MTQTESLKVEVVDEKETVERLAKGYQENIDFVITTALAQLEEIDVRFFEGSLTWSQYIKAYYEIANCHLLATLVSIGKEADFTIADDDERLTELLEGYAQKEEEALQVVMIATMFRMEDAHTALKNGDLSWQPFLLELREECRMNFKAMEEVAKRATREVATSD
ncbi:hypothetical protein K6L09_21270 [Burkholderia cepacia]